MDDLTQHRLRAAHGRLSHGQTAGLAKHLDRPVVILDVDGRADYWTDDSFESVAAIRLLNSDDNELNRKAPSNLFTSGLGDACNLSNYADAPIDQVHSNSVVKHVVQWQNICAMADDALHVGRSGWIETPAWKFAIECRLPFFYWSAQPLRRAILSASKHYGSTA